MIPPKFLMPIVAMVSFVGIYGISGSTFDLVVMVIFGVLGWGLRKLEVPLVPVILGILLGNLMEATLRRARTISDGDWTVLFTSPLALLLWAIAVVGIVLPILVGKRIKRRMHMAEEEPGGGTTTD
jgi:putative tricarboxylic transport membrane protein